MKLYRYISLQAFCELIFNSELTFKLPKCWPDQYEGHYFKLLESESGKKWIGELIEKNISSAEHREETKNLLQLLGNSLYCACFTQNADEEVMWNAYSYNNQAIMIETEEDNMTFLNAPTPSIIPVEYDLDKHKLAFLESNLFNYDSGIVIRNAVDMVRHKRECFSYEKEIRVVIQDVENSGQEIRKYPIKNISSFISGVTVHPCAEREYVKMIGTLCKVFSLKFNGKSKIYELDTSLFQPNEQNDISKQSREA